MASTIITRRNSRNITPDQADYRGHVLFDRTGYGKSNTVIQKPISFIDLDYLNMNGTNSAQ